MFLLRIPAAAYQISDSSTVTQKLTASAIDRLLPRCTDPVAFGNVACSAALARNVARKLHSNFDFHSFKPGDD